MKLRLYTIVFDGVFLGGAAIIAANDELEALALLEAAPHGMTELRNVKIKTTHDVVQPTVLYLDNGDY